MRTAALALRLLRRDWRSGELRLLVLAVVLAVTAVTAVSWLADRVGRASEQQAAQLLAADRAVDYDEPIPQQWLSRAHQDGLKTARLMTFPSVVLVGDRVQLVSVKAATQGYPLKGFLEVGQGLQGPGTKVRAIPEPGTVWVEPRLLIQLDLEPGDSLKLGAKQFTIAKALLLEPDRGGGFVSLAPRVLMNAADVPATQLVQPASRVRYRLLLAGPEAALSRFQAWVEKNAGNGATIRTPTEGQPGVQEVLRSARRFLGLSALLTVIIGGVAMLLTIRRYAARQLDQVAVMRCLGSTQSQILGQFIWKLFWLGLIASAVGSALGFGLHLLLLEAVRSLLPDLPPPGWLPLLTGVVVAQLVLLGFAVPTVWQLRRVPPLRVLRRDLGNELLGGVPVYAGAVVCVFGMMWWEAGDLKLSLYVLGSVVGTLLALAAGAGVVLWLVRRLRDQGRGGLLLAGVARRPMTVLVQVVALGLGIMALLLLSAVREDLLGAWKDKIPPDAPNYFLINVQPDETASMQALLDSRGVKAILYPMIRARLVAIDGRDVGPDDYQDRRAKRLIAREFNLSWATRLQSDNKLVAGHWWGDSPQQPDQFSVERELAQRLGIHMGDRLRFEIAGRHVEGRVTSLRTVNWDSFNVNFFVVSPPGLLKGEPTTYITSFYLPSDKTDLLPALVRQFPSVTVIDINNILSTVRSIIDQGARVVELMAVLTLVAGIVVLLAALQITREERRFESALFRSLGASRRLIRRLTLIEFAAVGAIAGGLGGLGAAVAGFEMAGRLFELSYAFDPWLIVIGGVAGAVIVTASGMLATRRLYHVSPMRLLQAAEEK